MTELIEQFRAVRARSESLCAELSAEDCSLQAMPDTSPVKWHLAHTTWFFDTFLLQPFLPGHESPNPAYAVLFNSYYNGVGEQFPRAQRSLLSRPALSEVAAYRRDIDAAVLTLLDEDPEPEALQRLELGLHHEAQHQELILTDLKYSLFQNPLLPAYRESAPFVVGAAPAPLGFTAYPGGTCEIGAADNGFAFDNERPRHPVIVPPFSLADRLVTNAEYLEFVDDGGYSAPHWWLADGWQEVQAQQLRHPLYWGRIDGDWYEFTLHGLQRLDPARPAAHLSLYEASAYAAWAGRRLPTEAEWELAAAGQPCRGNFLDSEALHPRPAAGASQLFGDCWEWTNSGYLPYPGFRTAAGAVGEYNGKFMSNQFVLRGGSCLSAAFHVRATYRNFFYAPDRWQCTGIRLAADQ